jgi:GTP-binding protein
MVPGDADDIAKEYQILLDELTKFNPELLDKQRILAITKVDMLDDELVQMLEETLPTDIPHVFISSVTGTGIATLKDMLWAAMNSESNKIAMVINKENIVHRNKDVKKLDADFADWEDEDYEYEDDDEEIEDLDDFEYED